MKRIRTLNLIVVIVVISFIFFFIKTSPSKADATYINLGTSDASDAGADAINFSQSNPVTIDKYGNYILSTENRGGTHHWTWSSNQGASWTEGSESYGFLMRGSVAYDPNDDTLHVIWAGQDTNDGIIYRRYSITRDGSNHITAISRDDATNINLQLDTSSSNSLDQPVALWVDDGSAHGLLVALWSKFGSSFSEVRGSLRHLSESADDGSASNWQAITGTGDSFSDGPAVEANKIYAGHGQAAASAQIRGGTGSRKDDLYVFVGENDQLNSQSRLLAYRSIWNGTDKDWSNGIQSPITMGNIDNYVGGYNLKYQLITKPTYDATNDRLYVGWAKWKDSTAGDTVSFAYLDSSDAPSSTYDVYSANDTHSYAPTLDLVFDNTNNLLYTFYVESTTNGTNASTDYKTFDGSTLSSSTRFYTNTSGSAGADGGTDIPSLAIDPYTNTLLNLFRVNGAIPPTDIDPHTIDFGSISLSGSPSPSPSPSPTPTPTPSPVTAAFTGGTNSDSVDQTGSDLDTTYGNSNDPLYIGGNCGATPCGTGLRFTNVTIPQGATINSAHVTVYSSMLQWNALTLIMKGEAVDNSSTFSDIPLSRSLTTASVTDASDVNWLANASYNLNDISSVVQEVVNRSGWASGNALSVILSGSGNRKFVQSYAGGSTHAPQLTVTYTMLSASPSPTPTPSPSPSSAGTLTLQVGASSDDVNEDDSTYTEDSSTNWIGTGGSTSSSYAGLRFNNVTIPKNSTITSAALEVHSSQSQWTTVAFDMSAEAVANSSTFSLLSKPSARTLTTASVSHNANVSWDSNTWYSMEDLTPVIQEMVNRSDWSSGNSLSVILKGTGGQWGRNFIDSYDASPSNASRLVITYE